MATYIEDLFDPPDVVRGGDFVLRLAEGLERPEQTPHDYVVTAQLAKCFDEALSLVRDAIEGRSSKACYLLGSFGSGSLLLRRRSIESDTDWRPFWRPLFRSGSLHGPTVRPGAALPFGFGSDSRLVASAVLRIRE